MGGTDNDWYSSHWLDANNSPVDDWPDGNLPEDDVHLLGAHPPKVGPTGLVVRELNATELDNMVGWTTNITSKITIAPGGALTIGNSALANGCGGPWGGYAAQAASAEFHKRAHGGAVARGVALGPDVYAESGHFVDIQYTQTDGDVTVGDNAEFNSIDVWNQMSLDGVTPIAVIVGNNAKFYNCSIAGDVGDPRGPTGRYAIDVGDNALLDHCFLGPDCVGNVRFGANCRVIGMSSGQDMFWCSSVPGDVPTVVTFGDGLVFEDLVAFTSIDSPLQLNLGGVQARINRVV